MQQFLTGNQREKKKKNRLLRKRENVGYYVIQFLINEFEL